MKATIEAPVERKVTLEMSESEAIAIQKALNDGATCNWYTSRGETLRTPFYTLKEVL